KQLERVEAAPPRLERAPERRLVDRAEVAERLEAPDRGRRQRRASLPLERGLSKLRPRTLDPRVERGRLAREGVRVDGEVGGAHRPSVRRKPARECADFVPIPCRL